MQDLYDNVFTLRRPRLLIQAARIGLGEYNRCRVLKKLSKSSITPAPHNAVQALLPVEESLEDARRSGDASYSPSRHVEVFTALLAEARHLAQSQLVS